jgi:toxin ParE1/3/4
LKVVWSPLALDRLRETAAAIARDKPMAARRWAASVFDVVETLSDSPRRGRVVPEIGQENLRELLLNNYRIVYQVASESIYVLTIRHGRRLLDLDELR